MIVKDTLDGKAAELNANNCRVHELNCRRVAYLRIYKSFDKDKPFRMSQKRAEDFYFNPALPYCR